jgi:macrodomain Ter protein organizer (MatP/YcbG family)
MNTIHSSTQPIIIDQTLPNLVVAQIIINTFPTDVAKYIAPHLKPKHMAICCQVSKAIRKIVTAEGMHFQKPDYKLAYDYWTNHIIRRWGKAAEYGYYHHSDSTL